MKSLLTLLSLATLFSCGETPNQENTQSSKTDIEIAEAYIENFEPEKAVPYLRKVSFSDPEYIKAQELLSTINRLYSPNEEAPEITSIEKPSLQLTESEKKVLSGVQKKWAKQQMENFGNYFSSYRIESPTKVVFVLG